MKHMAEQDFGSLEEMQEYIDKNVTGKKIDEIIPPKKGRKSNADKADDLMYEAYQSNAENGMELAERALELDKENARAYNYLAQYESMPVKALALFEKAALIERKKLGEDFFKEMKGHFWFVPETRPYMTARAGMAECHVAMEKPKEAIRIYHDMLKLNPNDNQGVRYELSSLYLMQQDYKSYDSLYENYKDDQSAWWLFNHAYYVYKTKGTGNPFNEALKKAHESNAHVIEILAGIEEINDGTEIYYSRGDATEASLYLFQHAEMWLVEPVLQKEVLKFAGIDPD
jgi:hypothetical protein